MGLVSLWQLARVGIQYLRGMSEAEALQRLVEVIAKLKVLGYDEKHAAQVVERLLKSIRTQPDDDAVFKALQKLPSA